MSDKHPAIISAEWLETCRFGRVVSEGDKDRAAAAMLRRIPALEAERDDLAKFVHAIGGFWGSTKSVLTGPESLAAAINRQGDELDKLRAEVDALRAEVAAMEPMDSALCERHSLVLRIGQPYIFRPVGDCETCADMARQAREAYGDERGAT